MHTFDQDDTSADIELNAEQREAVTWGDGPLLVFAGAGSGKTRVITARILHLVKERGIPPSRILGLTFTNKAAAEMRDRLAVHLPGTRPPYLGTFHAFCARLLRMHGELIGLTREFTILDESDQISVIKDVLRALELDPARHTPRAMRNVIERAKREGGVHEALGGNANPLRVQIVTKVHHAYQDRLERQNALDFGDLILRAIDLLGTDSEEVARIRGRYLHVLVDEFQDTDRMQARLLTLLAPPPDASICVVGDDDQSIYRWRGADVTNILRFRDIYPVAHVVKLERNYRSSANILEAARAVISLNTERAAKTLWTDRGPGEPIVRYDAATESDEARFVARRIAGLAEAGVGLSSQAVLYRIHAQSRALEDALREASIPYRIVGGVRFYDRAEIRDVVAFLRLAHNPDDDVALARVVNRPPRGLGDKTLGTLREAAMRSRTSLARAAEKVVLGGMLTRRACDALAAFLQWVRSWHEMAPARPPSQILDAILEDTGYLKALTESPDPEAAARALNVREMTVAVAEMETSGAEGGLRSLLERIALTSSTDVEAPGTEAAVLMTVHAAKGLEFDSVVVSGLEDELFPMRPFASDQDLDAHAIREELQEERRLFYVAVTRARRHLALTWSRTRRVFGGQSRYRSPSPFLEAISPSITAAIRREPSSGVPGPEEAEEHAALGRRVVHKRFGQGVVVRVEEGVRLKLVIRFDDGQIRKILEEFVHPL